jgi:predicted DNA-binding WGR domain protein
MSALKCIMFRFKDEENYRDAFYEMKQTSIDTWQARYGRYGSDGIIKEESMEQWDEKIKYIISKGYKEVGKDPMDDGEDLIGDEYELD